MAIGNGWEQSAEAGIKRIDEGEIRTGNCCLMP